MIFVELLLLFIMIPGCQDNKKQETRDLVQRQYWNIISKVLSCTCYCSNLPRNGAFPLKIICQPFSDVPRIVTTPCIVIQTKRVEANYLISPTAFHNLASFILGIRKAWWAISVQSCPEKIVEHHCCLNEDLYVTWVGFDFTFINPPSSNKDSECIFNYPSCPR